MDTAQILITELSLGAMVQIAGLAISLLTIAVAVGYFKGRFEGIERDVNEMKGEKKKELTEQQARNSDYHTRLTTLEGGLKNILESVKEMKADIKLLLSR